MRFIRFHTRFYDLRPMPPIKHFLFFTLYGDAGEFLQPSNSRHALNPYWREVQTPTTS